MKTKIIMTFVTVLMLAVLPTYGQCPDCSDGLNTGGDLSAQIIYGPTVPLSEVYRESVVGDYVAAGVGLRSSASGDITIALPGGATIMNAFLYWSIMQNSETPSSELADVVFNAVGYTGTHIGTAGDPCWGMGYIHNYVAEVTPDAHDGINSVTLAAIGGILREGASLVVVFDDPAGVPKEVIIQHGAVTFSNEAQSATFSGFSDLVKSTAKTTFIIGDGQANASCTTISDESGVIDACALRGDDTPDQYWDTDTYAVTDASDDSLTVDVLSGNDCLTWVAQVMSVVYCPWTEETSWAVGDRYVEKGNWAMFVEYGDVEMTVDLRADGGDGIGLLAGTVHFSAPSGDEVTVTITLNEGWRFQDEDENVKIQDYDSPPPPKNPKPGKFDHKDYADPESNSFEIIVPANNYYGVHVQVEWVDCTEDVILVGN